MTMIWNCCDKKIIYGEKTLLMGIVNVTPDSFSDGGEHLSPDNAIKHAIRLEQEGADIIDIGAQSTRPDSTAISAEEEWARLSDVLDWLKGKISVPVSVDTFYPSVAERALKTGVSIINDVSGIISPKMAQIVRKYGCGWILTHNGSGSVYEVKQFFENAVSECISLGIDASQLCLDMGIGFGKCYEESMSLIANISKYKIDSLPLVLGVSRKRVIGQGSGQENTAKRIYGNISADTIAIMGGADIIRLHDIENEKQGIMMADNLKKFRL